MTRISVVAAMFLAVGCAGSSRHTTHTTLPARARGCSVEALTESPSRPVQGLGDVRARCTDDLARDVAGCTRTLQDQVCALGGDVLWGVTQTRDDDGLAMRGYAGRYR